MPLTPYSQAMFDYWHGDAAATYTIHRDDGFSQQVPVASSFAAGPFNLLEQMALERTSGRVLDVGAGVGRHALALQERGFDVTAIELEPTLAGIMSERGVVEPLPQNIFSLMDGRFDTILMLMNGFGLVGTLEGARSFFAQARCLLVAGGQILCDSLDVRRNTNPRHLIYRQKNVHHGLPAGQMRFWIEYDGRRGERFDWLHIDFDALREYGQRHGWSAEMLAEEDNGHYLARLTADAVRSA